MQILVETVNALFQLNKGIDRCIYIHTLLYNNVYSRVCSKIDTCPRAQNIYAFEIGESFIRDSNIIFVGTECCTRLQALFTPLLGAYDVQEGMGEGLHRDWGSPLLDHFVTMLATLTMPIK